MEVEAVDINLPNAEIERLQRQSCQTLFTPEQFPKQKAMDCRQTDYDEAVGLIYEAALAPERLPDALGFITSLLDGDTSHLVGWNRHSDRPTFSMSTGLPSEVGPECAAHYAHIDPRRQLALTQSPGELVVCHQHFDANFVSRDEFYQDYLIPRIGVHYLLGANYLLEASDQYVILGFHRFAGHGPFDLPEIEFFKRLVPHLRRSLSLAFVHAQRQENETFGQAALEISNLAALGLSDSGKVIWANGRGAALLTAGVCLTTVNGILRATDANENITLHKAIRLGVNTRKIFNLALSSNTGWGRCFVTMMSMPERRVGTVSDKAARVLVHITSDGGQRIATVHQLRDLFRLSPAEARLVRGVARGESLEEYAKHEDLKRSTLKTQLKSAMEKMGAKTQRDIVRLVLPLPSVRE